MPNTVDQMLANAKAEDGELLTSEEIIARLKRARITAPAPRMTRRISPRVKEGKFFPLIPAPKDNYQPPSNIVDDIVHELPEYSFPVLEVSPDKIIDFY